LIVGALIWTALTVLNLFYPPLIVLQLAVIWGAYALLNRGHRSGAEPTTAPPGGVPRQVREASSVGFRAITADHPDGKSHIPMSGPAAQPSWADTDRLSQFKAGVMLNGIDVFSIPMTFVLTCINEPDVLQRLLSEASQNERDGCSFDEQKLRAARSLLEMWGNASDEERSTLQANDARLEQIKL